MAVKHADSFPFRANTRLSRNVSPNLQLAEQPQSLELRILRLGLFQYWNVWVGVFPDGEEILIGGFCLGLISRQRVSPAQPEMGKSSNRRVYHNPRMVVDFLKFSGC